MKLSVGCTVRTPSGAVGTITRLGNTISRVRLLGTGVKDQVAVFNHKLDLIWQCGMCNRVWELGIDGDDYPNECDCGCVPKVQEVVESDNKYIKRLHSHIRVLRKSVNAALTVLADELETRKASMLPAEGDEYKRYITPVERAVELCRKALDKTEGAG